MGLSETNLSYICVVGLVGIIAGLWPILASPQLRDERYFSLRNAFCGGVFLGAALIHLLPDSIDSLNSLLGPKPAIPAGVTHMRVRVSPGPADRKGRHCRG